MAEFLVSSEGGQPVQDHLSGTSLRQGWILILFLPHTCHRTDLVFSLILHPGTLSQKLLGRMVTGPFCSRSQSWQMPQPKALLGAEGRLVNPRPGSS